jgi:cell division protein ZapA
MPLVNVAINNRTYTVACDEGEEKRLHELAAVVDTKVQEAAKSVGQVGDMRLLLMAALLMADDLTAISMADDLKATSSESPNTQFGTLEIAPEIAAESLEKAAARVEDIAARLAAA